MCHHVIIAVASCDWLFACPQVPWVPCETAQPTDVVQTKSFCVLYNSETAILSSPHQVLYLFQDNQLIHLQSVLQNFRLQT